MIRKTSITTLLLVTAMLLSSCATAQKLATKLLGPANVVAQAQETSTTSPGVTAPAATSAATNAPAATLAPTAANAPAAPVGQPVVISSNSALTALQGTLEAIYSQVGPSVVNISVDLPATNSSANNPFGGGNGGGGALGSGFIWDTQGDIVTNNHVVDGATNITVTFSNGDTYPATLVGKDGDSDLAVIKVNVPAELLKPVSLADASQVKVGQIAIAIGNPFGLAGTMTMGIISALGRSLPSTSNTTAQSGGTYTIPDIIQTDAPINPGNSGGVLVDDQGMVLGVTAAIESNSNSSSGIGFVIPSTIVAKVIPSLIANGSYQHPWIGFSGISLTPSLATAAGLANSNQHGIMVDTVTPGSPAEKAGLKGSNQSATVDGQQINVGGDVIIAVDGQAIKQFDDLTAYLAVSTKVGQTINLTILRQGKQQDLQLTLGARPAATTTGSTQQPTTPNIGTGGYLGIQGVTLDTATAQSLNLPNGTLGVLVEQVTAGGPADKAGLKAQDVITAVDDLPVASINVLRSILQGENPDTVVTLTILRGGKQSQVKVTLGSIPTTNP